MKKFFLVLLALVSAQAQDFAPGTKLWLTARVSAVTNTGVIAVLPGTEVTVVQAAGDNLTLTDGTQKFEASRAQVTTNAAGALQIRDKQDSARAARLAEQEKQLRLAAAQSAQTAQHQAKSKRIIGKVMSSLDGGLIVLCDSPVYTPVDAMQRIGAGGSVPTYLPPQSEVQGTIWVNGYPVKRVADGETIDVRAYDAGIRTLSDGARLREYRPLLNK